MNPHISKIYININKFFMRLIWQIVFKSIIKIQKINCKKLVEAIERGMKYSANQYTGKRFYGTKL